MTEETVMIRKFLTAATGLVVLFVFGIVPCFAVGGFAVTNSPVGSFGSWAATTNAKPLAGDFNGDGRTDVGLTGPTGWGSLPVAFSNGDGTFNVTNQPIVNFAVWAATTNAKPLVGDFNGDGRTDVALTGPTGWGSLPVAFSNGDGTFNVTNQPIVNFAVWAATTNAQPLVGDFNGDGRTDAALTGPSGWGSLPVAFSNGNGTFNVTNQPIVNFAVWAATANAKPLIGDFNGDGRTDAALTGPSGWGSLPVAFSNGDGTFNVTNQPIADFAVWAATANAQPLIGDFNGDGLTDVALTGPSGWASIPVAFSNANGIFNVTNQSIINFATWAASTNAKPLVGNFNGDGRSDVVLTGPSGWFTLPVAFSLSPAVRVVNMVPPTLSGETSQDSEPFLALNPDFPRRMAGTAFTPNPGYPTITTPAPVYLSQNSGSSWVLNTIVPSSGALGTGDITVAGTSDGTGNRFYGGILSVPGSLLLKLLTTTDFTTSTLMTTQISRSQVDQPFVQGLRNSSVDRVFVGNNDFNVQPATATVDVTANGGTTWNSARIEKRTTTCGQDWPSIRPAVARDGTVYAAFFRCTNWNGSAAIIDVVVVRDDTWGTGATPFTALTDPSDGLPGMRVVTNVTIPWVNGPALGNQRIGSTLSLAVDPNNSNIVYVGWADRVGNGDIYTIHVRRSTNRGVTWSNADLLTVTNATNVALAIGINGTVGAVYQQVTGSGASQRWVTTLVQTRNGFAGRQYTVLATVPATAPAPAFQPYLGDYIHLLAVGSEFRGIFSANNTPNLANFPQGVIYQRQVNFSTMTLLNGGATVAISIDPFFFSVPMLT
ncbi:MAG TPA: VCBS repeat-containing protein [Pyrinomonadaceae bacterium]|nr:VCBS repeat-containing protein [Pyrinomonadaceae bacterium]